jgi:hypothetical protein
MTIEIFEAMSESTVANQVGITIKKALQDIRKDDIAEGQTRTSASPPAQFHGPGSHNVINADNTSHTSRDDALSTCIDDLLTSQRPFSNMDPGFDSDGVTHSLPIAKALFMYSADWNHDVGGFGV